MLYRSHKWSWTQLAGLERQLRTQRQERAGIAAHQAQDKLIWADEQTMYGTVNVYQTAKARRIIGGIGRG